jgi:hypothetical protein
MTQAWGPSWPTEDDITAWIRENPSRWGEILGGLNSWQRTFIIATLTGESHAPEVLEAFGRLAGIYTRAEGVDCRLTITGSTVQIDRPSTADELSKHGRSQVGSIIYGERKARRDEDEHAALHEP